MVLARIRTACVRSTRLVSRSHAVPAVRSTAPRAFSAFAPSAPALKKAGKAAQAYEEDEFVEDEFEDDVDSEVGDTLADAPRRGLQGQDKRAAIYEQALGDALKAVSKPTHELKRRPAPEAILASLVQSAGPQDLPRVVEVLQQWRQKELPAPRQATVQHLLKRFAESDRPQDGVNVLAQRDKYRTDVPADLQATYPLFHALSKPATPLAATSADSAAPTEEATEAAPAATVAHAPSSSDSAFVLYDLLQLYHPGLASKDSFVLLTTLAAALRNGESTSERVQTVMKQLQSLGEDQVVQQVRRDLSKRWQATMRMRARAIAYAMRDLDHAEFEWFAHLSETLQKLAAPRA